MGCARLNKGTKKSNYKRRRRIMCFSVGSPLQRHLPTTKWAVHPNSSAKLRNPETITKANRKNFSSYQNSFERYANTSRRLTPKLVYYLTKIETSQQNSTALFTDAHPIALPTHPTLFCPPTRAYAHSASFVFCLHPLHLSLAIG